MKRALILLISGLVLSSAAFAQTKEDLVGTWKYTDVDNSGGDICTLIEFIDFAADGTCVDRGKCRMELNMDEQTKFVAEFTYSAKGTWTLAEGIITYKFDPKTISVIKSEGTDMPGILRAMVFKPMINEMKKELKHHSPSRIVSFNGDNMILQDTNDKEPSSDLYHRQL